jgi:hypothetical protein
MTVLIAENRGTATGDDAFNMAPGVTSPAAQATFAAAYDAILEAYAALVPSGQVVKVPFSHNIEVYSPTRSPRSVGRSSERSGRGSAGLVTVCRL